MSNRKTYHMISDKIAVAINSTIQNWAPIPRENIAKRSICNNAFVFSMAIGNYRAYATIPRNDFSKNDNYLRKNPTEATIVMYRYFTGSMDLWWVHRRSDY